MSIFPVIEVPDDAAQKDEAMGTKFKFWFHHPELCICLFKRSRSNTGEDWSEKIAAELCGALGLPHARQELGIWQGQRGTVSPTMLAPDEELIHGNDILAGIVSSYPRHASSLGRELTDEKRRERLDNKSIGAYLKRNYSAFYAQASDSKSLTTIAVFQSAARSHPQAAKAWLSRLSSLSSDWLINLFTRIPEDRISTVAKEFAIEILLSNRHRLLTLPAEKL